MQIFPQASAADMRRAFYRLCHDLAILPVSPDDAVQEVLARFAAKDAQVADMASACQEIAGAFFRLIDACRAIQFALDPLDMPALVVAMQGLERLVKTPTLFPRRFVGLAQLQAARMEVCEALRAVLAAGEKPTDEQIKAVRAKADALWVQEALAQQPA
jgi:hypothetical protein